MGQVIDFLTNFVTLGAVDPGKGLFGHRPAKPIPGSIPGGITPGIPSSGGSATLSNAIGGSTRGSAATAPNFNPTGGSNALQQALQSQNITGPG